MLPDANTADPREWLEFVASLIALMTPDGEFILAKADGGPAAFDHYSGSNSDSGGSRRPPLGMVACGKCARMLVSGEGVSPPRDHRHVSKGFGSFHSVPPSVIRFRHASVPQS